MSRSPAGTAIRFNTAFWKAIKKAIPSMRDDRERTPERKRVAVFPPLSEARRSFEEYFKQPRKITWSEPDEVTLDTGKIVSMKKAANSG